MKNLSTFFAILVAFLVVIGHVAGVLAWQDTAKNNDEKPGISSSQAGAVSDSAAIDLLRQARNRLFERQSVQAEMLQVVTLGNYRLRSTGTYASASGFRFRLQYQIALGDLAGEFLEVCDGQLLHTRRQITPVNGKFDTVAQPETELTRRDIQRIRREALGIKDGNPMADLSDTLRAAEIGLGGLPAILAMLERTLIFEPVRTQTVEQRDYFVLQGRLRPDRKSELLTGLGAAAAQVAGFLPDVVRVYLSQETLFPEKFLYLKQSGDQPKALVPLITVEFSNVRLDLPVQEGQFIYMAPPGLEEKDETTIYIEMMRQAAAAALQPATPPDQEKNSPRPE